MSRSVGVLTSDVLERRRDAAELSLQRGVESVRAVAIAKLASFGGMAREPNRGEEGRGGLAVSWRRRQPLDPVRMQRKGSRHQAGRRRVGRPIPSFRLKGGKDIGEPLDPWIPVEERDHFIQLSRLRNELCRRWTDPAGQKQENAAQPGRGLESSRDMSRRHAYACFSLRFCRCCTRSSTTAGSASVDVSPSAPGSSSAILRRMRRMILPERVLGRLGAN